MLQREARSPSYSEQRARAMITFRPGQIDPTIFALNGGQTEPVEPQGGDDDEDDDETDS